MTQTPVFKWRRFIALAGGILLAATAVVAASRAGGLGAEQAQRADEVRAVGAAVGDLGR